MTDDSILSANQSRKHLMEKNRIDNKDMLCRGMVLKVNYVDDKLNLTSNTQNPEVTYDVILSSGPMEGQILSNVRKMGILGGQYNFSEIVLRQASKPFSGTGAKDFNNQDGDIVYVLFVNGNLSSPAIVGLGNHPLDATNTGATKTDGPRLIEQFNGVNTLIDKNGNYTITRKGGSYDAVKDAFVPVDAGNEAQIKFTSNKMTLSSNGQMVEQVIDGAAQKLTVTMQSGVTLTIDGAGNSITIKDSGGGTLKIANGKVGLGGSSAEVVDLISQIAMALTQSLGNLGYNLSNAATFAQIQAKADGIKGGI
jgi:hypothetical protein